MDNKTFINSVSKEADIDRETCQLLSDSLSDILTDILASGDSVSIPAFGNFEPRKRNERIISHPSAQGKRLLVPPKLVVNFKPSAILKNKVNSVEDDNE